MLLQKHHVGRVCRVSRPKKLCKATAAATSDLPAATSDQALTLSLKTWLETHGGSVHPHITIVTGAEAGRGLVARNPVEVAALEQHFLLSVPRHLHMCNKAAVRLMGPQLTPLAQERFEELEQVQQVAAFLASERRRGADSLWGPYIASLPPQPPNPWLLHGDALDDSLRQLEGMMHERRAEARQQQRAAEEAEEAAAGEGAGAGRSERGWETAEERGRRRHGTSSSGVSDGAHDDGGGDAGGGGDGGSSKEWRAAVEAARLHYSGLADEVLEVVAQRGGGQEAGPHLDKEELMWAMGQVVSRSLGSGRASGLLPFIDMANHHPGARPPMMQLDDSDQVVFTVTSIRDGELSPLAAGQELYISYQPEDMTPLQAWLKWGFVPRCLPQQQR